MLEPLSKMVGPSVNFVIFLMLFVLLLLPLLHLLSFRGKFLLHLLTPSIGVLLPLFRIKLLLICCLVLLPPMTYLESLDVYVLFFFKIMKETNFNLVLVCVFFLRYGIGQKGFRCYDPISKLLRVSGHVVFWEHKMFYQLPHVPVSPISSIDPLLTFFLSLPLLYLSIPPWFLSFPLLFLMSLLMHLMSLPHRSSTCPLVLIQLWILSVLLNLMHFVVPIV